MRPLRLAILLSLPALALAACGDSSDDKATGGAAAKSPASAPAASPRERLQASADALAATKGFHLEGTSTDKDGRGMIEGDIRRDGSLRVELRQGGSVIEARSVGGKIFFKADRRFWEQNGGGAATKLFAGKWVTGPPEKLGGDEFERFDPKTLGYCLTRRIGKLEDGGAGEVDGTRVTKVKDLGGAPGTAPGVLSIAAEGDPLPLRIEQTGRAKPGGKRDPRCDSEGPDTSTKEDILLSNFGADSPIEAPPDALDLEELGQGGGGGATPS